MYDEQYQNSVEGTTDEILKLVPTLINSGKQIDKKAPQPIRHDPRLIGNVMMKKFGNPQDLIGLAGFDLDLLVKSC